jgi:hypothetical protein
MLRNLPFALAALACLASPVLAKKSLGPSIQRQSERSPLSSSFSLMRLAKGSDGPLHAWIDEASLVRSGDVAQFWILEVFPQDQQLQGRPVSARWSKAAANCKADTLGVMTMAMVDGRNLVVAEQSRPVPDMIPVANGSTAHRAKQQACFMGMVAAQTTLRASLLSEAISWSRDPAAWARAVATRAPTWRP